MRRSLRAAAMLLLCGIAAACARPTGDFDRARDSVLHDEVLPAIGKARASLNKEPVSRFNLTDEEREMHDRVWRFLIAPHADDWFMDTVVEMQRSRLVGADYGFKKDRYFRWLNGRPYASSRTRYRTVGNDARIDVGTVPSTFEAVCRVIEIDRQRRVASRELGGLEAGEVAARRAENDLFIDWFTRALRYRHDSYNYALDRLLVETPHREAMEADDQVVELAYYVERAERGDFCGEDVLELRERGGGIPARVLRRDDSDPQVRK